MTSLKLRVLKAMLIPICMKVTTPWTKQPDICKTVANSKYSRNANNDEKTIKNLYHLEVKPKRIEPLKKILSIQVRIIMIRLLIAR